MVVKQRKIIISAALALVALGMAGVVAVYAYFEPQTWIGGIYLKNRYDPDEPQLASISDHLKETDGGYLPPAMDAFLFAKLEGAEEGSTAYANILGFYAEQSKSSRAGSLIFEKGQRFLPSIIRMGRESASVDEKLGFLFLAYGVANKGQAYKPIFYEIQRIHDAFDHIERGELEESGIMNGS